MCSVPLPPATAGSDIQIERPRDREFVRDLAGMLDAQSKAHIQDVCDRLLKDKATPVVVVTIESMARYGGDGSSIETFATRLFDQWQIGVSSLGKNPWNTGILLLISKSDRGARIELGAGWERREDALCQQIMDEQIIPRFKAGDFSAGIVAGVDSLDKMARKLKLPPPPRPSWFFPAIVGSIALSIFTAVSLRRSGSNGWAWVFWGVAFALLGYFMWAVLARAVSRATGGICGGGFSGGGGASGSW